jgi:predicted TPR repeat methyltransferase
MEAGDVCHRLLDDVEFEVKLLRTHEPGDCWDIEYLDGNIEEAVPVAELVVKEEEVAAASTSALITTALVGKLFSRELDGLEFQVKLIEKSADSNDEWTVEYVEDGNVESGVSLSELTPLEDPLPAQDPRVAAWYARGHFLSPPPTTRGGGACSEGSLLRTAHQIHRDCDSGRAEEHERAISRGILGHLGFFEKVRLQFVCRQWCDALLRPHSEVLFGQRAFLRGSSEVLRLHAGSNLHRRSVPRFAASNMTVCSQLLDVDVSCSDICDDGMLKIVFMCPSLTSLAATHCEMLGRGGSSHCTWLQALWKGRAEFSRDSFAFFFHTHHAAGGNGPDLYLPQLRVLDVWKSYGLAHFAAEFKLLQLRREGIHIFLPGFATVVVSEPWLLANVSTLAETPLLDRGFRAVKMNRPALDIGNDDGVQIFQQIFYPSPTLYAIIGPPGYGMTTSKDAREEEGHVVPVPRRQCCLCQSKESLQREQKGLAQALRQARVGQRTGLNQSSISLLQENLASVDAVLADYEVAVSSSNMLDDARLSMTAIVANLRSRTHEMAHLTKGLAEEALKLSEEGAQAIIEVQQKSREYRSYLVMQEGMKRMELARSNRKSTDAERRYQLQLAEDLLAESLDLFPKNQIASFKLAVLRGGDTTEHVMCPVEYTRDLFDQYASDFEDSLHSLKYTAPERIAEILQFQGSIVTNGGCILSAPFYSATPENPLHVLDCGCGTGWVGQYLKQILGSRLRIVGVDVAPKMVKIALSKRVDAKWGHAELPIYDEGYTSECMLYLEERNVEKKDSTIPAFDIVIAADLAPYIGDLHPFVVKAKKAMRDDNGALLVFTVEGLDSHETANHHEASSSTTDINYEGFALLPSERYAHSLSYLQGVLRDNGMKDVYVETIMLREESGLPLKGYLIFAKVEHRD